MNRVFVDVDGVIADFAGALNRRGITSAEAKGILNFYDEVQPIPGALEAVRSLIGMGFEVWLATKPPTGYPDAYADKVRWLLRHLPELKRRIILTHDKGLLGDCDDFLLDDRPHKANCSKFHGMLMEFDADFAWPQALEHFQDLCRRRKALARFRDADLTKPPPGTRAEQVLAFLALHPGWHSPTTIGREVWGPGRHSAHASPVCKRLVARGEIRRSKDGHYRFD